MSKEKTNGIDYKKMFSEMRKIARTLFKANIIDKDLYSIIKIAERKAFK
jgi:hypothetical protein